MMLVSLSSVSCSPAPFSTMPLTRSLTSRRALVPWSPVRKRASARSCSACSRSQHAHQAVLHLLAKIHNVQLTPVS